MGKYVRDRDADKVIAEAVARHGYVVTTSRNNHVVLRSPITGETTATSMGKMAGHNIRNLEASLRRIERRADEVLAKRRAEEGK